MCGTPGDPAAEGVAGHIDREALFKLHDQLIKSDSRSRAKLRGLDYQRRDQIIAGVVLVYELFKRLKIRRMQLCGSALREGILLDYLNRHIPEIGIRRDIPDPRRRSVFDLARRCNWHKSHSEHVAALALRLFDELKPLHGLGQLERELIEYGALLHDIGWHIGPKGHHKHSAYLILNGELRNFSQEEVRIIANIARYHRKATPTRKHESYASLTSHGRRIVDIGTALLRLADGLDRSHSGVVQNLQCRVSNGYVRCNLSTRSDAALELWGAKRKRDWFKTVFGRGIEFELK
jgi:exopolyphosphatase/guanosine-5'-triphosphate,3'-diphosphate pyrophosphatase